MKLDRTYDIACVCSAIFVCLPFALDGMIADIPDWAWWVMTALIAISFATMAVTFLMRKSRDWDRKHSRDIHQKKSK